MDELAGDPPTTKNVIGTKDLIPDGTLVPIMDPDQLIGYTFPTQHAGTTQRVEVLAKEDDKYSFSRSRKRAQYSLLVEPTQ